MKITLTLIPGLSRSYYIMYETYTNLHFDINLHFEKYEKNINKYIT